MSERVASRAPEIELADVQGIVLRGYGSLPRTAFLLFEVGERRLRPLGLTVSQLGQQHAHIGQRRPGRLTEFGFIEFDVPGNASVTLRWHRGGNGQDNAGRNGVGKGKPARSPARKRSQSRG